MQRILNTTLTVKQLLIAITIFGFMVTPWGMLYQQKQQWMAKLQQPSPVTLTVPVAQNPYPTLPPLNQLGKAFVIDNQAIRKLKALVNLPTSANSNWDRDQSVQVTHKLNHMNVLTQRCWLDGQSYVVGDIVKTPSGWVRCSLTIVDANSTERNLNWTPL
jgi:hypothetical protein